MIKEAGLGGAAPFLEAHTDALAKLGEWVDYRAIVEWVILEVFVGKFLTWN